MNFLSMCRYGLMKRDKVSKLLKFFFLHSLLPLQTKWHNIYFSLSVILESFCRKTHNKLHFRSIVGLNDHWNLFFLLLNLIRVKVLVQFLNSDLFSFLLLFIKKRNHPSYFLETIKTKVIPKGILTLYLKTNNTEMLLNVTLHKIKSVSIFSFFN